MELNFPLCRLAWEGGLSALGVCLTVDHFLSREKQASVEPSPLRQRVETNIVKETGSSLLSLPRVHWARPALGRSQQVHAIFLPGDPRVLSQPFMAAWFMLGIGQEQSIHYLPGFQTVCQPSHGNK